MDQYSVWMTAISGTVAVLLAIIGIIGHVIKTKLAAIEHATNSAASTAQAEIKALHIKIAHMTELMAEIKNPTAPRQSAPPALPQSVEPTKVTVVNDPDEPVDVAVVPEDEHPKRRK